MGWPTRFFAHGEFLEIELQRGVETLFLACGVALFDPAIASGIARLSLFFVAVLGFALVVYAAVVRLTGWPA